MVLRVVRIVVGSIVLVLGIVTCVPGIPGQGILTVLFGLWILSADVRLARRALIRLRIMGRRLRRKYRASRDRAREKKKPPVA